MKDLFPPNLRSPDGIKGVGSGSDFLSSSASLAQLADADVSMDDSHASGMSGVTTESMAIGSPPRTQRKKRIPIGLRSFAGPTNPTGNNAPDVGVSVRSRLFADDVDLNEDSHDSNFPHAHREPSSILKPFDLNQDFADAGKHPFNNSGDNDGGNISTRATTTRAPESPPTRLRNGKISNASTLTPFRPRRDRTAAMALRKRQADQDDLYGKGWSRDTSNDSDAFEAVESPVDMYTSPRISPSTPGAGSICAGDNGKSINRMANLRSPFNSKQQSHQQGGRQQQLQYHKSPSHFQTLDGRTVQSKNPFSPMIFDETPTPTPSKNHPPGNSPAPGKNGETAAIGLTHPLLFPVGSLNGDDTSGGGKSHLVLRHKLQKRGTSPCNNGVDMDGLTRDGMTPGRRSASGFEGNNTTADQLQHKASMYIRDGYPEQTGRYAFTGSPIKENFATTANANDPVSNEPSSESLLSHSGGEIFPLHQGSQKAPQDQDFCKNIHKVRRRSKGDDVVAAAAQGESTWKKNGMYINTNNIDKDNNTAIHMNVNNDSGYYNHPKKNFYYNKHDKNVEDSPSPTDVFNFPHFRASPSDTSTLPPTPSKPVRRPPIRRYTPIRKNTGPPPTPMPGVRQPRTFDFEDMNSNNRKFHGSNIDDDSSEDDDAGGRIGNGHRRRRPRRPNLSSDMDAPGNTTLLPSRFYSDFDVISELGSGSFGNVFKVLSRLDGCFYAIKVAHRVAKGISDKDRMLKEVYALAALSDRADTATFHIVRYHQAWMEEERLYIQTELCTTTLYAEMQQASPKQLPLATRYKFLREILLALNFIHSNQMVHLDIKPENIFVSKILKFQSFV